MNAIQKILHKYLPDEYIELVALEERQDDAQWMIKKGFQKDFYVDSKGFTHRGDLTQAGINYVKECERKTNTLFSKIQNVDIDTFHAREAILLYIKQNPKNALYKELSDAEKRAYNRILRY